MHPNPLVRFAALVGGVVVAIAAFFLGLAVLATLAGFVFIAATGISLRVWWARRKLSRAGRQPGESYLFEGEVVEQPDSPQDQSRTTRTTRIEIRRFEDL